MIKRLLLVLILLLSISGFTCAKDIPVKIETLSKISTSNINMHEGDNINFVIANDVYVGSKLYLKKGEEVTGVITSLVDNGFTCQEASIYAEQFRVKNINGETIKLKGIIYHKGRNHWMLTQFLPGVSVLIRGGEAQIIPEKDSFTLYLDGINDLTCEKVNI